MFETVRRNSATRSCVLGRKSTANHSELDRFELGDHHTAPTSSPGLCGYLQLGTDPEDPAGVGFLSTGPRRCCGFYFFNPNFKRSPHCCPVGTPDNPPHNPCRARGALGAKKKNRTNSTHPMCVDKGPDATQGAVKLHREKTSIWTPRGIDLMLKNLTSSKRHDAESKLR
jgi:hypothetical protein